MSLIRRAVVLGGITVVAAFVGCGAATTNAPAKAVPGVELTEIAVAGLDQVIAEQKGKVVYVDVWFLGCPPCVENFPHVVELHRKHAAAGLVVVTVDVNDKELKKKEKVLDFLVKHEAQFPNYILTDDKRTIYDWQKRNGAEYTPGAVVFDRTGARVPIPDDAPNDEIEAVLKKLLATK